MTSPLSQPNTQKTNGSPISTFFRLNTQKGERPILPLPSLLFRLNRPCFKTRSIFFFFFFVPGYYTVRNDYYILLFGGPHRSQGSMGVFPTSLLPFSSSRLTYLRHDYACIFSFCFVHGHPPHDSQESMGIHPPTIPSKAETLLLGQTPMHVQIRRRS